MVYSHTLITRKGTDPTEDDLEKEDAASLEIISRNCTNMNTFSLHDEADPTGPRSIN